MRAGAGPRDHRCLLSAPRLFQAGRVHRPRHSRGLARHGHRLYPLQSWAGREAIADYNAALAVAAGTPPPEPFRRQSGRRVRFHGRSMAERASLGPNPLDPLNGHGSHTSDILGGKSLDGLHTGTAPGTQLYAVKVCSSVSSSCSGVADSRRARLCARSDQ